MARSLEPIIDIDPDTGEYVSGWDRIKKSIRTILTTRVRTRLMRLWWGSDFINLQDKPATQEIFMRSIVSAARSINEYEPEFKVTKISIDLLDESGSATLSIYGLDIWEAQARKIDLAINV